MKESLSTNTSMVVPSDRKRLFKSGSRSSYYIAAISLIFIVSGYKNYVEATSSTTTTTNTSSSYGVVDFIIDLGMVFAPTIGYFDQIRLMIKNNDSKAFSRFISLILLSSNLLRIFFWYLKQFSMVMLFQSIVMILCQLVTLFVAVKYGKEKKRQENERNDNENPSALMDRENPRDFTSLIQIDTNQFLDRFWKWDDFSYYLWTNLFFIIFVLVISLFFYPIFPVTYTELLGMLSVTIEALLAVPQVITNFQNGSTEGLSLVLIATFVLGDTLKTAYFVFKQLPYQFVFCGAFQIFVDMIMVIQMIYYNFVTRGSAYANKFQEVDSIGELEDEEEEEEEINLESVSESKDQIAEQIENLEEPIKTELATQEKTESSNNKESESV
ncbi:predicted protein [Naegleria gruberi]|uniref:Predicted protein n=1 Tax=Naegleria gruberi TaxID=5762 RepID=D2VKC1_NAEGR|nr:uncharacterized protein NAEGRDRAFT_69341 [Naegleria gruberi]EFC42574.1 predicted protein [Naegleria gruberi]|eukprot:XP_002675318.1 predicted protein [Naegleria gruberi strain NEG-M]